MSAPLIEGVGLGLIVKFAPLSLPVTSGFEDITLILYPVPDAVFEGIVALIVPELVLVSVPMLTGLEKLPLELESCAVKMLPALKVPDMVKGTDISEPAQYELGLIFPVVIILGLTSNFIK